MRRAWPTVSILGTVLPLLSACAALAGSPAETAAPTVGPDGVMVYGHADYDWSLRTLNGKPVELEAYRGKVLFINLWASWCAPCIAEMAGIERLRNSLRGSEIEFLVVSPEDPEPVERFLKRYNYDLPIFLEIDPMPDAFGLQALPTTFVIDRDGIIMLRHRGAAEWDQDAIRTFLRSLAG